MDPEEHRECWDALSLSLVLNFVPDAKDRGKGHSVGQHFSDSQQFTTTARWR